LQFNTLTAKKGRLSFSESIHSEFLLFGEKVKSKRRKTTKLKFLLTSHKNIHILKQEIPIEPAKSSLFIEKANPKIYYPAH